MRTHSGFPNLQRARYVKFPVVTFTKRLQTRHREGGQSVQFEYAVAVADGLVINTSAAGDEKRFVNHGCRPNAELKKKRDPFYNYN